jgi:hypothetical protein
MPSRGAAGTALFPLVTGAVAFAPGFSTRGEAPIDLLLTVPTRPVPSSITCRTVIRVLYHAQTGLCYSSSLFGFLKDGTGR